MDAVMPAIAPEKNLVVTSSNDTTVCHTLEQKSSPYLITRCFQINTKTQSIYLDLESQKLVIDDLNGNTIVEKTNITNDQLFENQLSSFINNNNNLRNIDSLVKNLGIIDQCKEMNGLV
mgnify:CR=1 FL=1